MRAAFLILLALTCAPLGACALCAREVDCTTLRGKWLAGYQAWACTPNDAAKTNWKHYAAGGPEFNADKLVVDMFPDVSEYAEGDKVYLKGIKNADGSPAALVSGNNPNVIDLHFKWMRDYDIDGVFLQRFLIGLPGQREGGEFEVKNKIMDCVAASAKKYGRVWAINFDPPGVAAEDLFEVITSEWKRMVDLGYTSLEKRYLHHEGLPVVHIWSVTAPDRVRKTSPELAQKLLEFFSREGKYRAFFVAGTMWNWAREREGKWRDFYGNVRAIVPWNIGNVSKNSKGEFGASRSFWAEDKRLCESLSMMWIPTVYPGFSWINLHKTARDPQTTQSRYDRRGGYFLWEQLRDLSILKPDCVFLAMFDEVDEGTALFKINPKPPRELNLVGTDGLPSDWWLRLIREARRLGDLGEVLPEKIPLEADFKQNKNL